MKKKILFALTTAAMMIASTNAFAATKDCAGINYSSLSLNSLCGNYLGSGKLNIGNLNCIESSDINNLIKYCFNYSCGLTSKDDYVNEDCNKDNDCTDDSCDSNKDCAGSDCDKFNSCTSGNCGNNESTGNNGSAENNESTESTGDNQSTSESAYAAEVVRLVNEERAKEGLAALKTDAAVQSAAQIRAKETVTLFSHTRPDGSSCFTALQSAGAKYSTAGENIAYGQKTPAEVVNAWMNSEGHRANIMNSSFTTIGVGCYKSGNTYYWSQFFTA